MMGSNTVNPGAAKGGMKQGRWSGVNEGIRGGEGGDQGQWDIKKKGGDEGGKVELGGGNWRGKRERGLNGLCKSGKEVW